MRNVRNAEGAEGGMRKAEGGRRNAEGGMRSEWIRGLGFLVFLPPLRIDLGFDGAWDLGFPAQAASLRYLCSSC